MFRFALATLFCVGGWASADDAPKNKVEDKKPAEEKAAKEKTSAELVEDVRLATRKAAQSRTIKDYLAAQEKVMSAIEAAHKHEKITEEEKETLLVAKASTLMTISNFNEKRAAEFYKFAEMIEKDHPKSKAYPIIKVSLLKKEFLNPDKEGIDPKAVDAIKQFAEKFPKQAGVSALYASLAEKVRSKDGDSAYEKMLDDGLKIFPKDRILAGQLKTFRMMGKPMEIVGPTLEGSEFDIKSLKGKVVLVDFWATWCGPCIAELPNVQAAYKKYHEKGFEVVAISFDFKRDALEKYVKEKELPWVQIIFPDEKDMGWKNPIGKKYEISGIPATYLIGRDGNVVKHNLRGPKLIEAVEKELAKAAPSAN